MKRYYRILPAALLLSLLVPIAVHADNGTATREWRDGQPGVVKPDGIVVVPDRDNGDPLEMEVWVRGGEDRVFHPGEYVNVYFRVSRDAYVLLYDVDTEGRVHQIYPRSRWDDEFVEAGVTYAVPGRNAGYRLMVTGPPGREDIVGVASDRPLSGRWDDCWDGITSRNDYDELGGTRLRIGRFGENRVAEMDRLAEKLVEVPAPPHDRGYDTATDRVSIRIARYSWYGRGRWDDDRYYGRRGSRRW